MRKFFIWALIMVFLFSNGTGAVCAQAVVSPLAAPQVVVHPDPVMLRGIRVDPKDAFIIDFVIDPGKVQADPKTLQMQTMRQVKYFLAALTIPPEEMWVNLSPYEKDRIIPAKLGLTDLGRELLSQDNTLKHVTAAFTHPDTGKVFWRAVYAALYEKFGTTDIVVDAFNKVWIAPAKAAVHAGPSGTFVTASTFKVMLDSDRVAMLAQNKPQVGEASEEIMDMTRDIIRREVLPVLEKTVNTSEDFTSLRQIYHAVILAAWYRKALKDNIINEIYAGKQRIKGIDTRDPGAVEKIYAAYVEAFKTGASNIIREEKDDMTGEVMARKYFTGGANLKLIDVDPAGTVDEAENTFTSDNPLIARVVLDKKAEDRYADVKKWYTDPGAAQWLDITPLVTDTGRLPAAFPFINGDPIHGSIPLCPKTKRAGIAAFYLARGEGDVLNVFVVDLEGKVGSGFVVKINPEGSNVVFMKMLPAHLPGAIPGVVRKVVDDRVLSGVNAASAGMNTPVVQKVNTNDQVAEWYKLPPGTELDITEMITPTGRLPKDFPFNDGKGMIGRSITLCSKEERRDLIASFIMVKASYGRLNIFMKDDLGAVMIGKSLMARDETGAVSTEDISHEEFPLAPEVIRAPESAPVDDVLLTKYQEELSEVILTQLEKALETRPIPAGLDPLEFLEPVMMLSEKLKNEGAGMLADPEFNGPLVGRDLNKVIMEDGTVMEEMAALLVDALLKYYEAVHAQGYDVSDTQINELFFIHRLPLAYVRHLQRKFDLYEDTDEIIKAASRSFSRASLEASLEVVYEKKMKEKLLEELDKEERGAAASSGVNIVALKGMINLLEKLEIPGGGIFSGKFGSRYPEMKSDEHKFNIDWNQPFTDVLVPNQTVVINGTAWIVRRAEYFTETDKGHGLKSVEIAPVDQRGSQVLSLRGILRGAVQPYLAPQRRQELEFLKDLYDRLSSYKESGLGLSMIKRVLNIKSDHFSGKEFNMRFFDTRLVDDLTKEAAIKRAFKYPLTMIKGFAGSGKTTTLVEIIRQQMAMKPDSKILVISQMHQAVDVLLKQLPADILKLRLGRSDEKIDPEMMPYWIGNQGSPYLRHFESETSGRYSRGFVAGGTTRGAEIFNGDKDGREHTYDLIIHDEVSRDNIIGVSANLPYLKSDGRLVLVGDSKQLPPFGLTEAEKKYIEERFGKDSDVAKSMRLYTMNAISFLAERTPFAGITTSLRINHRSIPILARLISRLCYEDKMLASHAADHRSDALMLHQVKGDQKRGGPTFSIKNDANIAKVKEILLDLKARNTPPGDITVMTLYEYERRELEVLVNKIFPGVEVKSKEDIDDMLEEDDRQATITSVNKFQGGQGKIVIFDAVLSNDKGDTGFVTLNQLVVAFSRAQQQLHIVADFDTFEKSSTPGISRMFNNLKEFYRRNFLELFDEKKLPGAALVFRDHLRGKVDAENAQMTEFDKAMNGGIDLNVTVDVAGNAPAINMTGPALATQGIEGLFPRLISLTAVTRGALFHQ